MADRRKILAREFPLAKHTVQFCCGTTCDAKANLDYVRKLEARNAELEELLHELIEGDTEGITGQATNFPN